jgi:hypothetical protein
MEPWIAIEMGFVSLLWMKHESHEPHSHIENKTHPK